MLGTILFYLIWPIMWFIAPLRVRVRAMIQVGDEVLVVKHWLGDNNWHLPGGGKKNAEKSLETACREVEEELSIQYGSADGVLLNSIPKTVGRSGLLLRYQYVHVVLPKKPPVVTSKEISEYKWVALSAEGLPADVQDATRYQQQ